MPVSSGVDDDRTIDNRQRPLVQLLEQPGGTRIAGIAPAARKFREHERLLACGDLNVQRRCGIRRFVHEERQRHRTVSAPVNSRPEDHGGQRLLVAAAPLSRPVRLTPRPPPLDEHRHPGVNPRLDDGELARVEAAAVLLFSRRLVNWPSRPRWRLHAGNRERGFNLIQEFTHVLGQQGRTVGPRHISEVVIALMPPCLWSHPCFRIRMEVVRRPSCQFLFERQPAVIRNASSISSEAARCRAPVTAPRSTAP